MRLLLINPRNPMVSITNRRNYWNKYRVWKPLGLLVLAGLTPREWDIAIVDENVHEPDYARMPRPDLVGVTAFTSQAPRAYEVAAWFRARGVPVVMGGIHASMRQEEASTRVDAIVTGEAEGVWEQVLRDASRGTLQPLYVGGHEEIGTMALPRHDLLPAGYQCGVIQTTRGCPLNCSFCSVSSFNGRTYRRRAISDVIEEFKIIKEKYVLIVDDNLIGTRWDHIERAKSLFRAMIEADLGKKWICQATINMGDDEELLALASRAGCVGVFIGFESTSPEGLVEVHKKYNLQKARDNQACVRRIQGHNIGVVGSFIIGLDVHRPGIGLEIAATAERYGVDLLNVLFLTPLPGTDLWKAMEAAGRITADRFPEDWAYYTLTLPVGRYRQLSRSEIIEELDVCNRKFYSWQGIAGRLGRSLWERRNVALTLIASLSYRNNGRLNRDLWREFKWVGDGVRPARLLPPTGRNLHALATDSVDPR